MMRELQASQIENYLTHWRGQPVTVTAIHQLGGEAQGAAALKGFGYGRPLCIDYRCQDEQRRVVLRQIKHICATTA